MIQSKKSFAHANQPLEISLDTDVQYAVRDELSRGLEDFGAKAAVGIVLDVNTGEVWSMVSLPDFDPHKAGHFSHDARKNLAAAAVYEMGSVFKPFTFALGIDRGDFGIGDRFDARKPLKLGGHTIRDFHAKNKVLTGIEVFLHSSNIGTSLMSLETGADAKRAFMDEVGLLARAPIELSESARPIVRPRWTPVDAATISYGYGLGVTPIQLAAASAALVNGGYYIAPTILKRAAGEIPAKRQVLQPGTSDQIRFLMRANVVEGSGTRADVRGLDVGGKTGTAKKRVGGTYSKDKNLTSFVSVFPSGEPKFLMLVMLDEPTQVPDAPGLGPTGGTTAAPLSGRIINRIAPMMGLSPNTAEPDYQEINHTRTH